MAENVSPEVQKVIDQALREFNTILTMMKIEIAYNLQELKDAIAENQKKEGNNEN